jgi:hypothetical protein
LVAAVLSALILLSLSIIVYSPLHQDDPQQAAGVCPFCQFQHMAAEPGSQQTSLCVSMVIVQLLDVATPAAISQFAHSSHLGRAPPDSFSAL